MQLRRLFILSHSFTHCISFLRLRMRMRKNVIRIDTTSVNLIQFAPQTLTIKSKKMFRCKYCGYSSNRKDNTIRHENEKHHKIRKTCHTCGKEMTSSSFSRHKKMCKKEVRAKQVHEEQVNEQLPKIDLSAYNIQNDQIASVMEQTVKIKLITLKDGSVVSLHDDINIGGYAFTLTPTNGNS